MSSTPQNDVDHALAYPEPPAHPNWRRRRTAKPRPLPARPAEAQPRAVGPRAAEAEGGGMTTDWQQALAAESRPPRQSPLEELAAAARVTARNAGDKHDLAELLDAIGAPSDADTLTALLPHLPDTTSGDLMTTQAPTANAYAAAAVDMLTRGDNPDQVRETLGLSDAELAEAIEHAKIAEAVKSAGLQTSEADTQNSTDAPETAAATDGTDFPAPRRRDRDAPPHRAPPGRLRRT